MGRLQSERNPKSGMKLEMNVLNLIIFLRSAYLLKVLQKSSWSLCYASAVADAKC